jgi:hypothetical protein
MGDIHEANRMCDLARGIAAVAASQTSNAAAMAPLSALGVGTSYDVILARIPRVHTQSTIEHYSGNIPRPISNAIGASTVITLDAHTSTNTTGIRRAGEDSAQCQRLRSV